MERELHARDLHSQVMRATHVYTRDALHGGASAILRPHPAGARAHPSVAARQAHSPRRARGMAHAMAVPTDLLPDVSPRTHPNLPLVAPEPAGASSAFPEIQARRPVQLAAAAPQPVPPERLFGPSHPLHPRSRNLRRRAERDASTASSSGMA